MCVIEGRPTRTVRIIPIGLIDLMAAGCSSNLNTDSEMFCRTDDHEVKLTSIVFIADYRFGRSDGKTISWIQVTVSWLVESFNAIFNVFSSNTKIYKMKLEVLFFLLALEFQCLKGDLEILQKYKNQRVYSAQELHIKV